KSEAWIRLFARSSPESLPEIAVCIPGHGAILGAWLGAWVIPLDWDRPWQVWPNSCVMGAIYGYAVASVLSCIVSALYSNNKKKVKET
ncbi:hypothetical protein CYMTET_25125, partial [Cymbomonas tetramitiformis]